MQAPLLLPQQAAPCSHTEMTSGSWQATRDIAPAREDDSLGAALGAAPGTAVEAAVYQFLEGLASEELQAHAGVRGAVATACAQMS